MAIALQECVAIFITALYNVCKRYLGNRPSRGLIIHSDRDSQYDSYEYRALLKKHGCVQSMSGTGNCYDNAVMESFFHSLKVEHIFFEKYPIRAEAKTSIFDYIETFYNRERRHSQLNYASPLLHEKNYVNAE